AHKPVNATLNGKTFYPSEDWFATYYFKCDKPININIEIQPGINIQNPRTYQTIGEKLKKIDPRRYPYFDWKSGYKLTASDVAEFFNWKPMCDYDLKLAGVENLRVSLSETSYIYNGKVRRPKVTVKDINDFPLTKNEDYTVKYSSGRKNIGKYKVTVTFKGQYSGKKVVYFTINPKIKISSTKYTYTGKTKRPTVTITNSSGKKISTKYYSIGYSSGRKKVGKYTITIKFKKGHSGTYKKTFTIVPKGTTASKLTAAKKSLKVTIKKQSAQTTGYEIQYSTSKKFPKSTTKTKTINSYKTTRSTIKGLKAKRTYYVRVRTYKTVGKTKYYSAWSKYKSVKTK
ncbi:MAG: fibronectin type III domain-containing protein, partial [Clostridia bacterium]|nr:fibronectin type III domain-containing protein [Clostridia bacterium]